MESLNTVNKEPRVRVLFVCLGNICRSPLAEGVFRHLVGQAGLQDRFEIESCGTGDWHVGDCADPRMISTARRYGVDLGGHCARQFKPEDLERFDHIFVMDKRNLHDVLYADTEEQYGFKVRLFREFDPDPGDFQVPDPYYGGPQGFDEVYQICLRTGETLLDRLVQEHALEPRS
jgi:protein-tyrosine phosphatase